MKRDRFNPFRGAIMVAMSALAYQAPPPMELHHKKSPAQTPKPKPEPRRHWYSAKHGLLRGKLPRNYWQDVARMTGWQNTRWMRDGSRPADAARYAEMERL